MFGKKVSISFAANKLYRIVNLEEGKHITKLEDRRKDPTIPTLKPYLKIMVENESGRITRLSSHRDYMKRFEIIEKEFGDEVINFNAFETI